MLVALHISLCKSPYPIRDRRLFPLLPPCTHSPPASSTHRRTPAHHMCTNRKPRPINVTARPLSKHEYTATSLACASTPTTHSLARRRCHKTPLEHVAISLITNCKRLPVNSAIHQACTKRTRPPVPSHIRRPRKCTRAPPPSLDLQSPCSQHQELSRRHSCWRAAHCTACSGTPILLQLVEMCPAHLHFPKIGRTRVSGWCSNRCPALRQFQHMLAPAGHEGELRVARSASPRAPGFATLPMG